jgi:hypothetical protein
MSAFRQSPKAMLQAGDNPFSVRHPLHEQTTEHAFFHGNVYDVAKDAGAKEHGIAIHHHTVHTLALSNLRYTIV